MAAQTVFERHETKFLLDSRQYRALGGDLRPYMQPDAYGRHTICTLYLDTPGFAHAAAQLEKPVFREKLRLRSYGVPRQGDTVYLELKKKLDGVTYKRRMGLPLAHARDYLLHGMPPEDQGQVFGEIDWFVRRHRPEAKAVICYDRVALYGRQDPELRITFDADIRWRDTELELSRGDWGSRLTQPGQVLMEIKLPGTIPCWLARLLSAHGAYTQSFSKYTGVYQSIMRGEVQAHAG